MTNLFRLKIIGNNREDETDEEERTAFHDILCGIAEDLLGDPDVGGVSYGDDIRDSRGELIGYWNINPSEFKNIEVTQKEIALETEDKDEGYSNKYVEELKRLAHALGEDLHESPENT